MKDKMVANINKFIKKYASEKEFAKMLSIKIEDTLALVQCMYENKNITDEEYREMVMWLTSTYINLARIA